MSLRRNSKLYYPNYEKEFILRTDAKERQLEQDSMRMGKRYRFISYQKYLNHMKEIRNFGKANASNNY